MSTLRRLIYWTLVFVVNLFVPLIFASFNVSGKAWIGVSLAVGAYWLAGACCCTKDRALIWSLIIGGAFVCCLQLVPIGHIWIGEFALSVTNHLGHSASGGIGAFLATAITGGILLVLAGLIGLPFTLGFEPEWVAGEPLGKTPLFDREIDG